MTATDIFETHFGPHAVAVFVYDNSTIHSKYADDALRANNFILGDGGKNQQRMRPGYYTDRTGNRVEMEFQYPDGTTK
jgi:uncharacterized protein YutD